MFDSSIYQQVQDTSKGHTVTKGKCNEMTKNFTL